MIERYTIRFGPAVSQKELEKALHEPGIQGEIDISNRMHKMKARIEFIGNFEDIRAMKEKLKELSSQ